VNSIGERIAWAREERGITQAELARRAGVSQASIGGYESGLRKRPRELLSIARALEINPNWLETGEGRWDEVPRFLGAGVSAAHTASERLPIAFSRTGMRGPPGYVAMEPIKAWEYDEVMPDGEYAMVPRLDVKLSGGHGHDGAQQLDFGFDDGELRAYSADWIRKRRLKPSKLRVLKATGRSMERTIFDGDDLLVDLGDTLIVDGAVYALWYEGSERVKRLFRIPGGGLRISSDNKDEFPEIVLGPEYLGHVYIIGRVIDRSGPGGL
jgi:transcriptional regulator with XRE-family HTH domain